MVPGLSENHAGAVRASGPGDAGWADTLVPGPRPRFGGQTLAGALDGYRVLDLSRILSGPYCTMALADFGAEVIKVERPGSGDDTRAWGPPFVGGQSAYYLSINRSKRSITVDLGQEQGREIIYALARVCDVAIENFRPGTADRIGVGYERLRQENPQLIYCSISGFGQDGPYRDRPGYDALAQAMSGMMYITGEPDGPPTKHGMSIADIGAGCGQRWRSSAPSPASGPERVSTSTFRSWTHRSRG